MFGAINERRGALRELIVNSKRTFEATASRDEALAETFAIFPTFLDESKATMARLEDFSRNTHPLVNDLKGPADDLGPTVRDLGDLAPDLERLFRDLGPLIRESRTGVPALERTLHEAEPLAEALHTFLPELNPILSYFNFHQPTIAGFITNGGADMAADYGTGQRGQTQMGIIEGRSFEAYKYGERPAAPGRAATRTSSRTRSCGRCSSAGSRASSARRASVKHAGGRGQAGRVHEDKLAPCFELPPSLYDGKVFSLLRRGVAPLRSNPKGFEGTKQAEGPRPGRLAAQVSPNAFLFGGRTGGWGGITSSSSRVSSSTARWRRHATSRRRSRKGSAPNHPVGGRNGVDSNLTRETGDVVLLTEATRFLLSDDGDDW